MDSQHEISDGVYVKKFSYALLLYLFSLELLAMQNNMREYLKEYKDIPISEQARVIDAFLEKINSENIIKNDNLNNQKKRPINDKKIGSRKKSKANKNSEDSKKLGDCFERFLNEKALTWRMSKQNLGTRKKLYKMFYKKKIYHKCEHICNNKHESILSKKSTELLIIEDTDPKIKNILNCYNRKKNK